LDFGNINHLFAAKISLINHWTKPGLWIILLDRN